MRRFTTITDTRLTRITVGDEGQGSYGIYAETKAGVPVDYPLSMLIWHARDALHTALVAAAASTPEQPVVVACTCGDPRCATTITFIGATAVLNRSDGELHVAISPELYARWINGTSDGYEAQRIVNEAARAVEDDDDDDW